ncbi:Chromosome partition protein Smc [Nymphon striatum]|nr:Chromosome partition protein Smc [Nymphon striatum]
MALIFAVFLTNPAPICVLDEVDAPLDDHNVERFCNLMDEMSCFYKNQICTDYAQPDYNGSHDRMFGDIAEALSSVLPIEDIEEFGIGLDEMYGEVCQNTVQALPGISAAWKHCMGVTFSWELEPTTQKKMPLINWKLWIYIEERRSKAAIWCLRLAVFLVPFFILVILLYRFAKIDAGPDVHSHCIWSFNRLAVFGFCFQSHKILKKMILAYPKLQSRRYPAGPERVLEAVRTIVDDNEWLLTGSQGIPELKNNAESENTTELADNNTETQTGEEQ